jgi:hypothetical protein
MRDDKNIHEEVRWSLCDTKRGSCGRACHDTSDCSGYKQEYDLIEKEWSAE